MTNLRLQARLGRLEVAATGRERAPEPTAAAAGAGRSEFKKIISVLFHQKGSVKAVEGQPNAMLR